MTLYQITCDDKILYDPRSSTQQVISPKAVLGTNTVQKLSFTIAKDNLLYDKIQKRKSIIKLYRIDILNGVAKSKRLFRGIAIDDTTDFLGRKSITCEFEKVFLNDSILRKYEWKGPVEGLFNYYINEHNKQVERNKQFVARKCTVIDSNDYIVRSNENYPTTKDEMEDKLIDLLGGHFEFEEIDNKTYIDYLLEYDKYNTQSIVFDNNLLDISQYITAENVVTRLIPLGKKNDNGNYLTIKNVNNGKDYVEDESAINLFGIITAVEKFEDVTLEENLLKKGILKLQNNLMETITLEITAADLHMIDVNVEALEVGRWTRIVSLPHKLDKYFLLTKVEIYLDDIKSSVFTFGSTLKTYTNMQNSQSKFNQNISNQAQETSENALNIVSNIPNEYLKTSDFNKHVEEINKKISNLHVVISGNIDVIANSSTETLITYPEGSNSENLIFISCFLKKSNGNWSSSNQCKDIVLNESGILLSFENLSSEKITLQYKLVFIKLNNEEGGENGEN